MSSKVVIWVVGVAGGWAAGAALVGKAGSGRVGSAEEGEVVVGLERRGGGGASQEDQFPLP